MNNKNTLSSTENVMNYSKQRNEPEWLLKLRLDALKKFQSTEMPILKYGITLKSDISGFDLDNASVEEKHNADVKRTKYEKDSVIIKDIIQASVDHPDLVKNHLSSLIKKDRNKFTAFHFAAFTGGTFIYVPRNVNVEVPIEISSDMNSSYLSEHVLVVAEENSKVTIRENLSSKTGKIRSNFTEIIARGNASVSFNTLQNLDLNTYNFTMSMASVGKDASMDWFNAPLGSAMTLGEISTFLNGPGSACKNYGVFLAGEDQRFDLFSSTIHNTPNTYSDMLVKGASKDKAKTLYRGLIDVKKNANGTNGYQKIDTLILDDTAEADAVPDLLIDTNDVKCSHGATISQVDKDKMFYMMSRGVPQALAKKMVVEGFFQPAMINLTEEFNEKISSLIEQKMQDVS